MTHLFEQQKHLHLEQMVSDIEMNTAGMEGAEENNECTLAILIYLYLLWWKCISSIFFCF